MSLSQLSFLCSSHKLQTTRSPLRLLKQLHPATNHSKLPLIKSPGCTSGAGIRDYLQWLHRSTAIRHSAQEGLPLPLLLKFLPSPAWGPRKPGASGLKWMLLQFRKDVINFRSRAKMVQENSVHFWSEIFLRYWIILGNKTTLSVNGLFLSLSSSLPASLNSFPPNLHSLYSSMCSG